MACILKDKNGNVTSVTADNGKPSQLFDAINKIPVFENRNKAAEFYAYIVSEKYNQQKDLLLDNNGEPVLFFKDLTTTTDPTSGQFKYETDFLISFNKDKDSKGIQIGFLKGTETQTDSAKNFVQIEKFERNLNPRTYSGFIENMLSRGVQLTTKTESELSQAGSVGVGGEVEFTAKGGNKVVDEKGEPLTVYRSTFRENNLNDGVNYFAEDADYSKKIATIMNADGKASDYVETKPIKTIPVNISAKRVYELPQGTEMNDNVIKGLIEKDPDFTKKYDAVKGIDLYSDNKIVYAVFDKANIKELKSEQSLKETPPALRDVESTAKALEGVNPKLLDSIKIKTIYRGIPNEEFDANTEKPLFFSSSKKVAQHFIEGYANQREEAIADGYDIAPHKSVIKEAVANSVKTALYDNDVDVLVTPSEFLDKLNIDEKTKGQLQNYVNERFKNKDLKLEAWIYYNFADNPSFFNILKKNGYDVFEILEKGDKAYAIIDRGILKTKSQVISEAYHKAKEDDSNPELVKAVESLLSKEQSLKEQQTQTTPEKTLFDRAVDSLKSFVAFSGTKVVTDPTNLQQAMGSANFFAKGFAWHGSPYNFDKFTTEAIGTGEGAQAFGWGLYFTDLESIARGYAESLSKQKQSYLYKGNVVFGDNMYKTKPNESLEYDIAAQIISEAGTVSEFTFNKAKERLKDYFKSNQNEIAISKLEDIKFSDFSQQAPNKNLYKVSLHQGKTPDQYTWLEWDKPISKQAADKLQGIIKFLYPRTKAIQEFENSIFNKLVEEKSIPIFSVVDRQGLKDYYKTVGYSEEKALELSERRLVKSSDKYFLFDVMESTVSPQESSNDRDTLIKFKNDLSKTAYKRDKVLPPKNEKLYQDLRSEAIKIAKDTLPESLKEYRTGKEIYDELQADFANEDGWDYGDNVSLSTRNSWAKEASLFLLENGIDGVKYPAESVSRGATSDTARGFNYVVFDENAITIEEKIQFLKTPNGIIYGASYVNADGQQEIYINPEKLSIESLIHENFHPFQVALREAAKSGDPQAKAFIDRMLELAKQEVKDNFAPAEAEQILAQFENRLTKTSMPETTPVNFFAIGQKGAMALDKIEGGFNRLKRLKEAKELESLGKSNAYIKFLTGWERQDGKWKTEIDDFTDLKTTPEQILNLRENIGATTTVKEFFNNNAAIVLQAFPKIGDITVRYDDNATGAYAHYDPINKEIVFYKDYLDRPVNDIKSSFLHEIQHAIQQIEGFDFGADENMQKILSDMHKITTNDAYFRSASEVEARNIQKRMLMSAKDRLLTELDATADVLPEDRLFIADALDTTNKAIVKLSDVNFVRNMEVKPIANEIDVVNGFYSPIEKILTETKIEKQSGAKWLSVVGKGDEATWTGVKDWLEENSQKQISKSEIQQWMKDNRIEIVEVVKGSKYVPNYSIENEPPSKFGATRNDLLGALMAAEDIENPNFEQYLENRYGNGEELLTWLKENTTENGSYLKEEDTKFGSYQLEGEKENYKEVLVTLPSKGKVVSKIFPDGEIGYIVVDQNGVQISRRYEIKEEANEFTNMPQNLLEVYKSNHYNEPNILVHLRMNTRTDADGNKILMLEEIQSDFSASYRKSKEEVMNFISKNEEDVIELYKKSGKLEVEC
jgi:hypothetical protein